jgi:hypothetical protein
MGPAVVGFSSVEGLAAFVHAALCEKDALDPRQAPLFRTPLRRAGRTCGLVFHVEGPRLLRTSAVWSADGDRVIFYDSTGTRFREISMAECGIRIPESGPEEGGSGLDSPFRTSHSAFPSRPSSG